MLDTKEFEELVGKENLDKILKDETIGNAVEKFMKDTLSIPDYMLKDKMFEDVLKKYYEKRKNELNELIKTRIGVDMNSLFNEKKNLKN